LQLHTIVSSYRHICTGTFFQVKTLAISIFHRFFYLAVYRNCGEIYKSGERKDGVYTIKPDSRPGFDVFCDQTTDGGGWIVFQKRLDGSVDFFLDWSDYKVGFGDLNGEFWLGLDKINRLTSDDNSMLRVDLEDFEGNTAYAEYDMFSVMSENDKYKLNLGSYSGDSLRFSLYFLRQQFVNLSIKTHRNRQQNLVGQNSS